jgi:hypothetical protein
MKKAIIVAFVLSLIKLNAQPHAGEPAKGKCPFH